MPSGTSTPGGGPNAVSSLCLVLVVGLFIDRQSFVNHCWPQKSLIIQIRNSGTAVKKDIKICSTTTQVDIGRDEIKHSVVV